MTARPDTASFSDALYEYAVPLAERDDLQDWALLVYLVALSEAYQEVDDLVRDRQEYPGWSILLDVNACPLKALPWLAQIVGVQLPSGLTEQQMRDRIVDTANWKRGRFASMVGAISPYLTGSKTILFRERYKPSDPTVDHAYWLTVRTYKSETPVEDWAATNINPNGGFEVNTTGWDCGGGTIVRSTNRAMFGNASGLCAATVTAPVDLAANGPGSGITGVVAGETYSMSGYVKREVGARTIKIVIQWKNVSNGVTGTSSGVAVLPSNTSFQRIKLEGVIAPALTVAANVLFETNSGVVGDSFYIDGAQLEANSIATPYIETAGAPASRPSGSGPVGTALKEAKPAGIILDYDNLPGQDWQTVLNDFADWQAVANTYATWGDVAADTP